jgi:hypothetical protein
MRGPRSCLEARRSSDGTLSFEEGRASSSTAGFAAAFSGSAGKPAAAVDDEALAGDEAGGV